ncbi:GNAT family N-acetyltransferase [Rhodococcus marinonascens]|uniref:GNAT family N-acetyltransferase n=1 Tax=Rhodococcus marinonascens TaxID=38311 RepID=UPI0009323082|nr:GNAT family N-acetyltransferase [Rhodococcus marinonascens]
MLNIELAGDEDAAAILALRHGATDWLAERGIRQWDRSEMPMSTVLEHVRRREYYVVSREPGGPVLGALRLVWSDLDIWGHQEEFSGYVHGLVIDRSQAGTKLGSQLLEWAAGRARNAGAALLRLDCTEHNMALRDYYARAGFVEVGRRDFGTVWYSLILLERRIASDL